MTLNMKLFESSAFGKEYISTIEKAASVEIDKLTKKITQNLKVAAEFEASFVKIIKTS